MIATAAYGRVNLIGEHTDYNDGFVLPTLIPQRTFVELQPRADRCILVTSDGLGQSQRYELGAETRRGTWIDYIQGCTAALAFRGCKISGASLHVRSQVPIGAGLASSAALEVAVLRAFREANHLELDDVTLALMGQRAENVLVGAPVGAMDQMVASVGTIGFATLIDMRTLDTRKVPLPDADLLVISSGVVHDHATGDYRTRRGECEAAARALGVRSLRELGPDDLQRVGRLAAPLDRRVRHVISENARVLAAVMALATGNLSELGQLFRASHASMRDDYEVSIPAIDALVELAQARSEVYGARLTGGGFGGSIVAFAQRGSGPRAAAAIAESYRQSTGHTATVLLAGAAE